MSNRVVDDGSAAQPAVAFLSAEVAPFAKVGGLGDVAGSLPVALQRQGTPIVVLMPRYGSIDPAAHALTLIADDVVAEAAGRAERFGVFAGTLGEHVRVLLLDHPDLFGAAQVYVDARDRERFAFFCRAVPGMLSAAGFRADVFHANDWHTALALVDAEPAARVFTIHNMAHQGITDVDYAEFLGMSFDGLLAVEREGPYPGKLNQMARAIVAADKISTVSPRYAREIMTPEYGAGLDSLLRSRAEDVVGILNGIDIAAFNPGTDPAIPVRYGLDTLGGKARDKAALQQELGIEVAEDRPLVGIVSRLDDQKGFDLILAGMGRILDLGVQIALLGSGAPVYHDAFSRLAAERQQQVAVRLGFDVALAQRIYAGSDMFLMPSRFEPCGLGQMIAMRYGSVPVVRATGGLADTVSESADDQNGFTFVDYSADALVAALARAVSVYSSAQRWRAIVANGMRRDVSWDRAAGEYQAMYRAAAAARDARLRAVVG